LQIDRVEGADPREEGGLRLAGIEKSSRPGKPLISVITVVFNGASTIKDTIESVLNQTYDNVEFIIIDGGSTDKTIDVIRQYQDKIDYWISEKDKGLYDAMNKGVSLANGSYIGMLNADDYYASSASLDILASVMNATNADVIFATLDIVDSRNPNRVLRKYRIRDYSRCMMRIGVMPPHPTVYCKKDVYMKAGPYRLDYQIAADFEMLVRLLLKHKVTWHFVDEVMVKMRAGGLSSGGLKSNWILNREIIRACRENGLYTNMFMLALKLPIRLWERLS
jgi:glycosyltransferase involved in cell wall biosynthesis